MLTCCCSGCRTGCRQHKKAKHESGSPISNSNYSLHIFPKDEDLKNKWVLAIGRKNFIPSKYSRVCSRHFHESCFRSDPKETRSKLKSNAIPTIFPNEEDIQYSLKLPSLTKILNTSAAFEKSSKESSPVPEETVNLSASMEVDKSVGIMLSSKQCRYLKRQFRKLKDMSQSHSEFLAKELKCPQDYISECFSLYKDYIKCQTETNSLLKSSNKDPLEFNEDELMKELEKDYEDFEVLNFEDETVRDHLVVVD
uniref:THAP domain-containing protein 2 n=1 Tax=Lepeophtheirus salmonis TaxID=72036 RepID=C1BS96_LEPSM|nr:THAP domain-containing protein 2 [Lepeophtheirus salmonis]